jgi:hypothetical protein
MNRFTRIVSLLAVVAAVGVLPGAAHAMDNDDPSGPGGCHYSDSDGYDIPIHDGETVFVDGKLVTCKGGTITITTAPAATQTGVKNITAAQRVKALMLQKATLIEMRQAGISKSSTIYSSIVGVSPNGHMTPRGCQKMLDGANKLSKGAASHDLTGAQKHARGVLAASMVKTAGALGCQF